MQSAQKWAVWWGVGRASAYILHIKNHMSVSRGKKKSISNYDTPIMSATFYFCIDRLPIRHRIQIRWAIPFSIAFVGCAFVGGGAGRRFHGNAACILHHVRFILWGMTKHKTNDGMGKKRNKNIEIPKSFPLTWTSFVWAKAIWEGWVCEMWYEWKRKDSAPRAELSVELHNQPAEIVVTSNRNMETFNLWSQTLTSHDVANYCICQMYRILAFARKHSLICSKYMLSSHVVCAAKRTIEFSI